VNEYGDTKGYGYSPETIAKFKIARMALLLAQIYVQRIDWLVSGDDGNDSFLRRLESDLNELNKKIENGNE
jgi:hypothetical protein